MRYFLLEQKGTFLAPPLTSVFCPLDDFWDSFCVAGVDLDVPDDKNYPACRPHSALDWRLSSHFLTFAVVHVGAELAGYKRDWIGAFNSLLCYDLNLHSLTLADPSVFCVWHLDPSIRGVLRTRSSLLCAQHVYGLPWLNWLVGCIALSAFSVGAHWTFFAGAAVYSY